VFQAHNPVILNIRSCSEVAVAGLTPRSNDLRRQIVYLQLRFFKTLRDWLYTSFSLWIKS